MIINVITTLLCVITLFFLGHITQAFKKIFSLLTNTFLKILNIFGIRFITDKEKHVKVSDEFKKTYKDIKVVKLSKKNIKQKSSIDWISLAILCIAGLLVLLNSLTNKAISTWLWEGLGLLHFFIKTPIDMNVYYTAILFSGISFALTKLLSRWKETKQQRVENKQAKIKAEAIKIMDSKELVDSAKKKDEQKYKELK